MSGPLVAVDVKVLTVGGLDVQHINLLGEVLKGELLLGQVVGGSDQSTVVVGLDQTHIDELLNSALVDNGCEAETRGITQTDGSDGLGCDYAAEHTGCNKVCIVNGNVGCVELELLGSANVDDTHLTVDIEACNIACIDGLCLLSIILISIYLYVIHVDVACHLLCLLDGGLTNLSKDPGVCIDGVVICTGVRVYAVEVDVSGEAEVVCHGHDHGDGVPLVNEQRVFVIMNKDMNVLVLAYLGDSIFEVYIRKLLVEQGISKVDKLQKEAVKYVSAKGQAKFITKLIDNNFLTEEELEVFYRARNHKSSRHPKNTDIITYKYSTGFEAIIGYLYLDNKIDRIRDIIDFVVEV